MSDQTVTSMFNQPPGQTMNQGSTAFNSTSQYSALEDRNGRGNLIARAIALQEQIKINTENRMKRQAHRESKNVTKNEVSEKILRDEAKKAFDERLKELEVPRMGYFDLVPNDDANTEVLTNEQVYADLQKLEGVLGKSDEAVNVKAITMRSKKK